MTEMKAIHDTLQRAQDAICAIEGNYFERKDLDRAYYLLEDVRFNVYLERTTDLHPSEVKAVISDLERAHDHVSNVGPFDEPNSNASYYDAMALLERILTVLS
jgi:hypothetical protein